MGKFPETISLNAHNLHDMHTLVSGKFTALPDKWIADDVIFFPVKYLRVRFI